ncbi:archaemetzincin-1 [Ambystoma mexicanum]|uniref:archaemetzincin-1 n=1 Tax=Ambystoma mexicanum TaxID=8296 RepID=UPI0037E95DA7
MMLQCRHSQEFSFGPRALKDALISTNPVLQELYAQAFSSAEKLFLSEAYNPQRTLFSALQIRTAFDWLMSHPDAPEDFEAFYYSFLQKRKSCYRKHIYLQPIDLDEGAASISLLDSLRSSVEAFFLGLCVKCLPSVPVSAIDCCRSRQNRTSGRVQIHADSILTYLKKNKPVDALCILALTLRDLYPCKTWNYTFSKSLVRQEVGVCSFARISEDFPQADSETRNEAAEDAQDLALSGSDGTLTFGVVGVIQCCKVTCHEISLLIGLGTCRWLRCLMQGVLSLDEVLMRPQDLCPICLRKLQYILGFKLVERYKKLLVWTESVQSAAANQISADHSISEDILPLSSDSGICGENESDMLTSLSEALSLDACSHGFSSGQEMEQTEPMCSLEDVSSPRAACGAGEFVDTIKRYETWLGHCIAALEKEATDDDLSALDRSVDALARRDMFTGQRPIVKKELQLTRGRVGLRRALGDRFSSLRRKLSSSRLTKDEPSPPRWSWEDS